ncbi:MAG: hypothetical protein KDD43_16715 [Bdellovibrionales bacterium]|nr:hypothetical protein [Bdellovibrionales bacterium]
MIKEFKYPEQIVEFEAYCQENPSCEVHPYGSKTFVLTDNDRKFIDPVPQSVSDLQIRLALNQAGLRPAVEAYVAAAPQEVKDWWERARSFERNHLIVLDAAEWLSISSEELDSLWILASRLGG